MKLKLLFIGLLVLCAYNSLNGQANLSINVTAPPGPHPSDLSFLTTLQYSCASTVSGATNARLEVPIDSRIRVSTISPTIHVTASGYDAVNRVVWFEFVNPLPSGSSGELSFSSSFERGTTPDGYSATIAGSLTADNATTQTSSAVVTASSSLNVTLSKETINAAQVQGETYYEIQLCNSTNPATASGQQTLSNVVVTDTLPPGVDFIAFGSDQQAYATYNPSTRVASWSLPDLTPNFCYDLGLSVRYSNIAYGLGETVINRVAATGITPAGTAARFVASASSVLSASQAITSATKSVNEPNLIAGSYGSYSLSANSMGGEYLDNLQMTDQIPPGIRVSEIRLGTYSDQIFYNSNQYVSLTYQTNLNSSFRTIVSNAGEATNYVYRLSDLGLTIDGPEYITSLRWNFGNRRPSFITTTPATIHFRVDPNSAGGTISNCSDVGSATVNSSNATACVDLNVSPRLAGSSQYCLINFGNGNNSWAVDSNIEFIGEVAALQTGSQGIDDLNIYWLIPKGINYIANSLTFVDEMGSSPQISYNQYFSQTHNLLKAQWTGPGGTLAPGENLTYSFETNISNLIPGGYDAGGLFTYVKGSNPYSEVNRVEIDQFDVDQNGNSTEQLCGSTVRIDIDTKTAVSAVLGVLGSNDIDYTTFPAVGSTRPGGLADYRLTIENLGNIALSQFLVIDLLPHVADIGVIDFSQRDSRWRPLLIGPVEAPAGVTVYYSTQNNPCRAADGIVGADPPGCQTPNWTVVTPSDVSTVQSLKFDFGNRIVAPGDNIMFSWPMRTPTNILTAGGVNEGDIAWNSFGYVTTNTYSGNRLLPAEPTKSGLSIAALRPGVIGDRVWEDTNGNGIQDAGEPGLNGIHMELYRDNGDGVADCSTDTQVGFTVTTIDGSYLFSDLAAGNYFMVLDKPATYDFSPLSAGANNVDNDFVSASCRDWTVGVSRIVAITAASFEYDIDAGLTPSGTSAIGDYVWLDANANGLQDEGANAGINEVELSLLDASGAVVASQLTRPALNGSPGKYVFDGVIPGIYRVRVENSIGSTFGPVAVGANRAADSNLDPGTGATDLITLTPNQYDNTIDISISQLPTEICDNGLDDDGDGLIDCQDQDCPGANVVSTVMRN